MSASPVRADFALLEFDVYREPPDWVRVGPTESIRLQGHPVTVTLTARKPWGEVTVSATGWGPNDTSLAGWQAFTQLVSLKRGVVRLDRAYLAGRWETTATEWEGPTMSDNVTTLTSKPAPMTLAEMVDELCRRADADELADNLAGQLNRSLLRRAGQSARAATSTLRGLNADAKRALLAEHGINFDARPAWERHGIALWWDLYTKTGWDPVRNVETTTERRRVHVARNLTGGADCRAIAARILGWAL
ncbi:hypothetical protein [Parafrankia sp. EUN1f]|uniref:hypothetical protein n=1 Tax=Parafrankia sp. EUN1f TaxID=102897 RepID=UPI0001C46D08|nr:hypothetical protein [Parafrankia sp. EUN1f]EFC80183.1 hypothetical protein FrEUN1fDRAFT_6712 [Parafrankia sp. EUN1f]